MRTINEVIEVDGLEARLLDLEGGESEAVLYAASFVESEERFVKYNTVQWVLYSLLLILAWGIGFLMLLYLPVRRFVLRTDIRSRKLYLTPNSIVYKVTRPVPFPCFGVLQKEKHVLLQNVADVVVEQGYLQSHFGVYSLRIENIGVRRPPSDDVKIQGVANPHAFRKAIMMRLSNMRNEMFSTQVSTLDVPHMMMSPSKSLRQDSTSGELLLLQKLEEVGNSVKKIQCLFEEQQSHTAESTD
ncbi:uncharacterized protein LOC107479203 [Arachis duranensis]|uniref:Uncharacterized protein LOC107479203 n=1 Tax=Arachis duranensis TaxID=130453 RepID=A0A6P4CQQ9_ARADU|nr:uncharacterized protein LOC107479203 [Arachis duranensis]XP_015954829.1 uncharacterized protein LOC107479203 [Arachis duranensis]XP_057748448.1 uncharacterized protein LOC130967556 [Arachis stenosperma]XP_057748449.1 uncharacterized protein LOC130967556 [Arachis stenosperma]